MITFTIGELELEVNRPLYGYVTTIQLPRRVAKSTKGYTVWDNYKSGVYGIRSVRFTIEDTRDNLPTISNFFKNPLCSRCEIVSMDLGDDWSEGFNPFGPDLGAMNVFTVIVSDFVISKSFPGPSGGYIQCEIELQLVTAPSYNLPQTVSEGLLTLFGVSGLRYPKNGFNYKAVHGFNSIQINGNTPFPIDYGTSIDIWENSFVLTCNLSNAANILYNMFHTTNNQLVAPLYHDPFGVDHSTSGTFNVVLLNEVIEITHQDFNEYNIPLKLWMQEKV